MILNRRPKSRLVSDKSAGDADGAYVWAIHGILAKAANGVLRIFSGAKRWGDITFAKVYAGEQLVVSARRENRVVSDLENDNRSAERVEAGARPPDGSGEGPAVTLRPGANRPALRA